MIFYEPLLPFSSIFDAAGQIYHVDPGVLAAICWQESRAGLFLSPKGPAGTGDSGHGRGLFQIDDRWHPQFCSTDLWKDPVFNCMYATRYFRSLLDSLGNMYQSVCAYNAGLGNVRKALSRNEDPDLTTTHQRYGKLVMGYLKDMASGEAGLENAPPEAVVQFYLTNS